MLKTSVGREGWQSVLFVAVKNFVGYKSSRSNNNDNDNDNNNDNDNDNDNNFL